VIENYGSAPADIEMHAAEERLRCYQFFGADLLPGGGVPALTAQVAEHRARAAKQRRPPPQQQQTLCPSCHIALPLSGVCDNCS
jgi:hypothetical protein